MKTYQNVIYKYIVFLLSPEDSGVIGEKSFYHNKFDYYPNNWIKIKAILWWIISICMVIGIARFG